MRLQKHLASSSASPEDLAALLDKASGTLPLLRALQAAHKFNIGGGPAAEMEKNCCVAAAKVGVLLKCRLVSTAELAPSGEAVLRAAKLILTKNSRVQPVGTRLLPSACAVDNKDPFHMDVKSAIRAVGIQLSKAICHHLSESTGLMIQELFASLGNHAVLASLFGNAMRPAAGIPCKPALEQLVGAATEYIAWHEGVAAAD